MKTELKDRSRLDRMVRYNIQQTTLPDDDWHPSGPAIAAVVIIGWAVVMLICSF